MIRAVSFLFVSALVLCAWIVMRGQNGVSSAEIEVAQETGSPLGLNELTPARPSATAVLEVPDEPEIPSKPQASALRQRLASQGRTTLEIPENRSLPQTAEQSSQPERPSDPAAIQAAVMAALAPLKPQPESPAPAASLGAMSDGDAAGVLQGLLSARGLEQSTETQADTAQQLGLLVAQALQDGQSDAYVTALLNAAHKEGMYEASEALVKEDGSLDASTLLTQIVSQATHTPAAPQAIGGAGVEVRTVQRADKTEEYRFYTVQAGDSLGYIAQKFYGDAALYTVIWDANRAKLSSPNQIRSGQRLSIPSLGN